MNGVPVTTILIHHGPRSQSITVLSPGQATEFHITAAPNVALRALADYLVQWAAGRRLPHA